MRRLKALFPIALAIAAITLAPAAGAREATKIKACQTISQPGSYELVDNLNSGGAADCLVITADHVTIDLAGFSIINGGSRGARGYEVRPQCGMVSSKASALEWRVHLSLRDCRFSVVVVESAALGYQPLES